jgi:hypothetical protein
MQNKHYMSKDDGPIITVNLNKWAGKRKEGYVFRTEADYNLQRTAAAEDAEAEATELPTMENTKAEIIAFAEANAIEIDPDLTKSELLDIIEAVEDGED